MCAHLNEFILNIKYRYAMFDVCMKSICDVEQQKGGERPKNCFQLFPDCYAQFYTLHSSLISRSGQCEGE